MKREDMLYNKSKEMSLSYIPYSENLDYLKEKLNVGKCEIKNRVVIQPMEGCDGTFDGKPSELTERRYERFARSGAGIIWLEAVSVLAKSRANPRQLFMNKDNIDSFKRMNEKIKEISLAENGYEPKIIMQATHSGRYSKPNGKPEPIIAYNNPIFEKDNPIDKKRIITDDELKKLEERFGEAAYEAKQAGFDGIDIKCCHRYLNSELLSAYEREGEFGGSFENRTRLLRNGIKNAQSATDSNFITTTRLNVYDAIEYPYGFGVKKGSGIDIDLSEPIKLVDILHNQLNVDIINITIGNPYFNPYINRPANTKYNLEIEDPIIGVDRMYYCVGEIQKEFPNLAVIGSGVSYFKDESAYLASGAIKEGYMKMQGFGRMSFAYPDFYKDILKDGYMKKEKCCIACGKCTELMRAGTVAGCVVKDGEAYMPYYKEFCIKK